MVNAARFHSIDVFQLRSQLFSHPTLQLTRHVQYTATIASFKRKNLGVGRFIRLDSPAMFQYFNISYISMDCINAGISDLSPTFITNTISDSKRITVG
jgi:hypothetical protein